VQKEEEGVGAEEVALQEGGGLELAGGVFEFLVGRRG
jgi:hypothetical protein